MISMTGIHRAHNKLGRLGSLFGSVILFMRPEQKATAHWPGQIPTNFVAKHAFQVIGSRSGIASLFAT